MPQLAVKTLAAFEAAVKQDQGNTYRMWLGRVMPHIGDAYRHDEDGHRTHLGASLLGRECARELWYGFHWVAKKSFDGRMLRLFNRGHLEEGRFIALLLTIGCQVYQQDENGKQYRISEAGGHVGGSGDGMCDGIPDLPPGTRCLTEFKTHNDKSFKKLKDEGVREAKFEHFVQMQLYMRKMHLGVAVYFAVNKNDDEIYAELVPLDAELADRFLLRGVQIVMMPSPPERIGKSASHFGCKWCDHKAICHSGAPVERNCRTCASAEVKTDGTWFCNNRERQVNLLFPAHPDHGETYTPTKQRQQKGCDHWAKHPEL